MKARKIRLIGLLIVVLAETGMLAAILSARPRSEPLPPAPSAAKPPPAGRSGDQELAHLLVKLELETRRVIAEHYTRPQSFVPGVDVVYKRWLTNNLILPAAVAGRIFADTVPETTGGRAWVKMVVAEPRNEKNRGDDTALEMLAELKQGAGSSERSASGAYYYGEPIAAKAWCLRCHGEPRGAPDPSFPKYRKDGWREGEVIGGVIARVAAER